jgi:hypothetical protein
MTPTKKQPKHGIRFSSNKPMGVTRISFLRGLRRVGDPIYAPEYFRASRLLRSMVCTWLQAGEEGCSLLKAKLQVKQAHKAVHALPNFNS